MLILILFAGILGLWACFGSAGIAAEPRKLPNIVFVLADDLGYGEIGSYGQKIIHTPVLDKLATEGMRFTQHYTAAPYTHGPLCADDRQASRPRLVRNNKEVGAWYSFQGELPLPKSEQTLPAQLKGHRLCHGRIRQMGAGPRRQQR